MIEDAMSRQRIEITSKSRTDFQLYVNWSLTKFPNVIDFTERRLLKLGQNTKDKALRSKLFELLSAYKQCKVAISWTAGEPSWTSVQREN